MSTHDRKSPTDPNLAIRIEVARRRLGLTQKYVARQLNKHDSAVSHWETGRYEPPRDKIVALAKILHVSVGWLMGETAMSEHERALEGLLLGLLRGDPKSEPTTGQLADREKLLAKFQSADDFWDYLRRYRFRPVPPKSR